MAVFISHSPEETVAWAEQYAKTLREGDTVLLDGNMGAGKTTLAKGIAKGLGVSDEITSPTYAYVNTYGEKLFHFDCYRIASERQAVELGFLDYFRTGGVRLVEWSEKIAGLLPENCKRVAISGIGDGEREIVF